jgi:anti-anti-sigma regulatory factor
MPSASSFRVETIADRGLTVLRVLGPRLEIGSRDEFSRACDGLLSAETGKVAVDLTQVDRIFSLFIGTMVDLHVRAERVGKRLSIMASDPVYDSLARMGLEKTLDLVRE